MTDPRQKALLPAGLQDLLPPLADQEDGLSRALLDRFVRLFPERYPTRVAAAQAKLFPD